MATAADPDASTATEVGYVLVAALMGLAILEHLFMLVPLPVDRLWAWSTGIVRAKAPAEHEAPRDGPAPRDRPGYRPFALIGSLIVPKRRKGPAPILGDIGHFCDIEIVD